MSTTLLSGFVLKGEKMVAKEGSKLLRTFFFFLVNMGTIRMFLGERERLNMESRGRRKRYERNKLVE